MDGARSHSYTKEQHNELNALFRSVESAWFDLKAPESESAGNGFAKYIHAHLDDFARAMFPMFAALGLEPPLGVTSSEQYLVHLLSDPGRGGKMDANSVYEVFVVMNAICQGHIEGPVVRANPEIDFQAYGPVSLDCTRDSIISFHQMKSDGAVPFLERRGKVKDHALIDVDIKRFAFSNTFTSIVSNLLKNIKTDDQSWFFVVREGVEDAFKLAYPGSSIEEHNIRNTLAAAGVDNSRLILLYDGLRDFRLQVEQGLIK